MSKEITLQEAALAWAQGKRVEATTATPPASDWRAVNSIGTMDGWWNANVFGESAKSCRFRLAPEPHAKRYRPWTPEEVPVGALIRAKGLLWRGLILGVNAQGQIEHFVGRTDCGYAMNNHLHSIDNGKTWLPCGVEVSE